MVLDLLQRPIFLYRADTEREAVNRSISREHVLCPKTRATSVLSPARISVLFPNLEWYLDGFLFVKSHENAVNSYLCLLYQYLPLLPFPCCEQERNVGG